MSTILPYSGNINDNTTTTINERSTNGCCRSSRILLMMMVTIRQNMLAKEATDIIRKMLIIRTTNTAYPLMETDDQIRLRIHRMDIM